jgi:ABC-type antimicrobial peptide transport system permease subunit
VGLVLGQGLRLTAVGMAIGTLGALGVTRVLRSLLYGVSPTDPLSFAAVAVLLMLVAIAAAYLPARRATRVDPIRTLRAE